MLLKIPKIITTLLPLIIIVIGCSSPFSVQQPSQNDSQPALVDESVSQNPVEGRLLTDAGDHYILGGDIILNKNDPEHQSMITSLNDSTPQTLTKTTAMRYVCVATWPSGVVKYSLTGFTAAEITVIKSSMKMISDIAKVTYTLTTEKKSYIYKISKIKSTTIGGQSTIGYSSTPYCQLAVVNQQTCIHEFMHGLGFGHEHQRYDRDSYVKINTANIMTGYADQFTKIPKDYAYTVYRIVNGKTVASQATTPYTALINGYDYSSIMHYPKNAFAKSSNLVTISTTKTIGTTTVLSANDKSAVVAVYGKK
jgi:hypothetical protein